MSVESPANGEVFTVRIYKAAGGNVWANTYEIQTINEGVTTGDLVDAAQEIVSAERAFHFEYVQFSRVVISTYVPDGTPYNPATFRTVDVGLTGQRVYSSVQYLPLTTCVYAKFNASTGRTGKRFYRGCLDESDVDSVLVSHFIAGTRRDFIRTRLDAIVNVFWPGIQMVLARGTPEPTNVRVVQSVSIAPLATMKKLNNRYFDMSRR